MFAPTVLSQLFVTERHRPKADDVGFSVPAISEIDVEGEIEPLLASNMRNSFLRTHVSSHGTVRYGYSECPLEQEGALLGVFYRILSREASEDWGTVRTVAEACDRMKRAGLTPAVVVQPEPVDDSLPVLTANIPEGCSLVVAKPEQAGIYTRIGEYVGILAYRIDSAFVAVEP